MNRIQGIIGMSWLSLSLLGCAEALDPVLVPYLSVIERVSENLPDTAKPCFAATYWPDGEIQVPDNLLRALEGRGWGIYYPITPRDMGNLVVHVSEPTQVGDEWSFMAGYSIYDFNSFGVSWWARAWFYLATCEDESCVVSEETIPGHFDGMGVSAEVLQAMESRECG